MKKYFGIALIIVSIILAIETNDKSLEYIEDETINETDQPKQVAEED